MLDIPTLINHWLADAAESWIDSESLLEKRRFTYAAFTMHLAVEKTLKAAVVSATGEMPPRIHNLIRLADLAGLDVDENQRIFLAELNEYQLEARYKDVGRKSATPEAIKGHFVQAREFAKWVRNQLKRP